MPLLCVEREVEDALSIEVRLVSLWDSCHEDIFEMRDSPARNADLKDSVKFSKEVKQTIQPLPVMLRYVKIDL